MITQRKAEIKAKMASLVKKWKGKNPKEYSSEWCARRVDRSYYIKLRSQLRDDIVEKAKEIFNL
jgi:uncharacterized protein YukE